MWPFSKKNMGTRSTGEPDLCPIVDDYLSLIPEQGDWDDETILRQLTARGHDTEAACYIMGLVPIFVGRHFMRDLGVQFSDSMIVFRSDGGCAASLRLSEHPAYIAVVNRAQKILQHRNVSAIAMCGSELDAVNQALNDGSKPENLRLSSVALILGNG